MGLSDFEKRMYDHASSVKNTLAYPFKIESEELIMTKEKFSMRKTVLIAVAIICILGTTVFAAYHYLTAKDVANTFGDTELAKYFGEHGAISETITDGGYKATVLGIVSGENISNFESSAWEIFPERTYAVVAVEKTDGTSMTFEDTILVSPLIEGLKPWEYNIFRMNGGYQSNIIDGVLYRIIEFDSIEYFADRKVYMAILSDSFIDNKPYSYNEETGVITANKDYEGTNILIELELDKSKADPDKAEQYLKKVWASSSDGETDDSDVDSKAEEVIITPDMNVTTERKEAK